MYYKKNKRRGRRKYGKKKTYYTVARGGIRL